MRLNRLRAVVGVVCWSAAYVNAQDLVLSCNPLPLSGTFSDLRGSGQPKPAYVGTEIRLVTLEEGYQASVRFGGSRLVLADVKFEFEGWPLGKPFPEHEPDTEDVTLTIRSGRYSGVFRGTVRRDGLTGSFAFKNGKRLTVDLPRAEELSP